MVGNITVTDRAAEKIRQHLGGTNQENGLRLKVVAGGCSGLGTRWPSMRTQRQIGSWRKTVPAFFSIQIALSILNGTELDYKTI